MIKGMYTSANGMLPGMKRQDLVANNLANSKTAGFKKDVLFTKELSKAQAKNVPSKSDWQRSLEGLVFVDQSQGVFDKTDDPLNLAIEGDGFFQLESPDGATVLTRSGAFVVDREGYLSYPGGYRVLGDGGPIEIGTNKFEVSATGQVEIDGNVAGSIRPKSVADATRLQRLGGTLFAVPQGEVLIPAISASVRQGYLESSNVDVVNEMVDMIVSYRMYEANARALTTQESSLEHLFHRVASK